MSNRMSQDDIDALISGSITNEANDNTEEEVVDIPNENSDLLSDLLSDDENKKVDDNSELLTDLLNNEDEKEEEYSNLLNELNGESEKAEKELEPSLIDNDIDSLTNLIRFSSEWIRNELDKDGKKDNDLLKETMKFHIELLKIKNKL